MMKVLIVDGAEEFRCALADAFKEAYIVHTCSDGETALEVARSYVPDILVVDLTLSGMDGLSVIQIVSENQTKPIILATTRFVSDYVLEASSRIGVDYMIVKPCNIRAVVSRVADLVASREPQTPAQPDYRAMVAGLLLGLGIATNRKGYNYLMEAIPIYSNDTHQSITKELYPAVGKSCGAAAIQVERAIRSAIEKAWEQRDDQVWRHYFSPRGDGTLHRPSNSEFISRLAELMILKRN